jgi:hypothetical protein
MKYILYGVELEVQEHFLPDELIVMEGMHYILCEDTGEVFCLSSILTKTQWLRGFEYYSGKEAVFPMNNHRFCDRPMVKKEE